MSDGQSVRRILNGRTEAYAALVRRHAPRILAICHARVGRAEVAEELAQETLFRGLRSISSLGDPEKFGSWLAGIAARVCLDWLNDRSRQHVPLDESAELKDARRSGDVDGAGGDDLAVLMSEVQRLPEKHREVIMLYYYQDCTYEELGRQLGVSAATINARLTQARQMLRQKMCGGPDGLS